MSSNSQVGEQTQGTNGTNIFIGCVMHAWGCAEVNWVTNLHPGILGIPWPQDISMWPMKAQLFGTAPALHFTARIGASSRTDMGIDGWEARGVHMEMIGNAYPSAEI